MQRRMREAAPGSQDSDLAARAASLSLGGASSNSAGDQRQRTVRDDQPALPESLVQSGAFKCPWCDWCTRHSSGLMTHKIAAAGAVDRELGGEYIGNQ